MSPPLPVPPPAPAVRSISPPKPLVDPPAPLLIATALPVIVPPVELPPVIFILPLEAVSKLLPV